MVKFASSAVESSAAATAGSNASQRGDASASDGDDPNSCDAETSGHSHELLPTMLFRLALSLRRCGETEEADILFSRSSRLLAEQYVCARLRTSRQSALAQRAA